MQFRPNVPEIHNNFGIALKAKGDFEGALVEFRRTLNWPRIMQAPNRTWRSLNNSPGSTRRFAAISAGTTEPVDANEQTDLAKFALFNKGLPIVAARWFRAAFAAEPQPTDDVKSGNRYHAACAAALASVGNDDGLSDDERTAWRAQAREWLTAELQVFEKLATSAASQAPEPAIPRTNLLRH